MKEEILQLVEQVKTEQNMIIKARLLKILNKDKDVRVVELSRMLEVSPSYVCNVIRLLKLPEIIIDGYYSKTVAVTHLFIISRLHTISDMVEMYEEILKKALTTIEVEALVRQKLYGITTFGQGINKDVKEHIVEKFKNHDDAINVKVIQTRVRGRVIIEIKGNMEKTSKILKRIAQQ